MRGGKFRIIKKKLGSGLQKEAKAHHQQQTHQKKNHNFEVFRHFYHVFSFLSTKNRMRPKFNQQNMFSSKHKNEVVRIFFNATSEPTNKNITKIMQSRTWKKAVFER